MKLFEIRSEKFIVKGPGGLQCVKRGIEFYQSLEIALQYSPDVGVPLFNFTKIKLRVPINNCVEIGKISLPVLTRRAAARAQVHIGQRVHILICIIRFP